MRATRRRRVWGAAVAALLAVLACSAGPGPGQRIVLVTLDTLRYDSFAGSDAEMPRLRDAAREALVFRRHYAATSTTQPTHATLLTGLHPWQHGVSRNGAILPPRVDTVAERLRRAGWETAAVVASFPLDHLFGFAQGFDRYDDAFTEEDLTEWEGLPVPARRFYSRADVVTARAEAALDRMSAPHQFLWVHYFDPHDPYGDGDPQPIPLRALLAALARAPADFAPQLARAREAYGRDVRFLDAALGALLERLRRDAARFETHVVVVADHGESFGEGGSLGHGKRLSPEQIHVPLLILSPRVRPGVSDAVVGSVDVAATLLALAGLAEPAAPGRDLTRPLAAREVFGMRRTFAQPYGDLRTDGKVHVVEGLLFYAATDGGLYTGDAEGVAASDGAPPDAERVRELRGRFATFAAELDGAGLVEAVDSEARQALEALGYAR